MIPNIPSVADSIGNTINTGASSLATLMASEKKLLESLPWHKRKNLYLFGQPWSITPRGPRRDEWLLVSAHTPNVRRCISERVETLPGFGYTVEEFPKLLEDNLPNRLQFNTVPHMNNVQSNVLDKVGAEGGFRKGEYAIIATTTSKTLQQGLPNRRQFGSVTKLAKRISQYTPI